MQYTFASHCYACLVDEALVLLSIVDNRYLTVNPMYLSGVTFHDGMGAELRASRGVVACLRSSAEHVLLEKLSYKGLLGSIEERAADRVEPRHECKESKPRSSLMGKLLLIPLISQTILLLISWRVQRMVRRRELRSILHSSSPSESMTGIVPLPHDIIRLWVNYKIFRRVLPRADQCLIDSLTIAVASRMLGHRAEIMFGVKAAPFAAHCWPTFSGTPLKGSPLEEQEYQPIMQAELRSDVRV